MELKFLDVQNCHVLMPRVRGFSLARTLDDYLNNYINNEQSILHGAIEKIIIHNEKSKKCVNSSQRLCNTPVEIAIICDAAKQALDVQSIKSPMSGTALFHTIIKYPNGITWKTIIPLQFLLKGWGDANHGYQGYCHSIATQVTKMKTFADMKKRENDDSDVYHYIGITSKDWLHRFRQHMGDMKRGSLRKFHLAWHEYMGRDDVHFISQLAAINMTYEDAMNWEEQHVDRLGSNGLNMIPGGFKGLKYLYKHRVIDRTDISIEERERAIAEFVHQHPRIGIPNPFIAELWEDDDFYLKVIEAKTKNLTAGQVRQIREMAKLGQTASDIAKAVDALNELQVKNVISGKYYGRIH